MVDRPVNFSAGPAILAPEVLAEAARGVLALDGPGLSVLEISHRSPPFERILFEARDRLRRLLSVPDTHEILFLQGGARGQFAMVPLNFVRQGQTAAYVDTGAWSRYALEEAGALGHADAVASGKGDGYAVLPDLSAAPIPANAAYVHTTSNNTLYGTQWRALPDFGEVPHVSDMSSDFMSRPVDVSRFHLIYAGAQKNAGPAGVTIVIVDREWMAAARQDIPKIWQYRIHAAKDSMFQTPPTFSIYVVGLVAAWLEELGGVDAITARNAHKAGLVYDAIAASDGYYRAVVADPEHRSTMNVTWRMASPELEAEFVRAATAEGLIGLKGHRAVGGLRASIYNQMPVVGVERLVSFMTAFAQR